VAIFDFSKKQQSITPFKIVGDQVRACPSPFIYLFIYFYLYLYLVILFLHTNNTRKYFATIHCCGATQEGNKLLVALVGDALIEPFWPLGTGANRAILSALDTTWMVKGTHYHHYHHYPTTTTVLSQPKRTKSLLC
jgi:hypothetical protein